MIPQIQEINFPPYATLCKATVEYKDMGEKTITSQVAIDGMITPDFSSDWEVHHMGEKFIMPLRTPQASKENTSLSSKIDLTFQHWAIYQLKRWYFVTLQSVEAGVAVADKYIASVSLNLKNFCDLYAKLLSHYYGDKIRIDLNLDWKYAEEPIYIDINYSYMWDVLLKMYELFAVRWEITADEDADHYVIRVGYPTQKLDHIFEYGFKGGLMKVERQVQDDNIRNMLLGRGGDKNIPYRYFKKQDSKNPTFQEDSDWIPELENLYFDRLLSAEFRSYIQGWKAKHYPTLENIVGRVETYVPWAWDKGYTDETFNPVEYVKDDDSIRKYGELMGGLGNNDEIYPSIRGVVIPPYGRIDQVVDVEQVTGDDVEGGDVESDTKTISLGTLTGQEVTLNAGETKEIVIDSENTFNVPSEWIANITRGEITSTIIKGIWKNNEDIKDSVFIQLDTVKEYALKGIEELPASAIGEGVYRYRLRVKVKNLNDYPLAYVTFRLSIKNVNVSMSPVSNANSQDTFNIWIKNIWQTSPNDGESAEAYAKRVWEPILGNHLGDDAAVCFSSGLLSTSEDYEFKILGKSIANGIHYDTSKKLDDVQSHWRLTLIRSTTDYDSLGKLVPNTERQGAAGDYFYFTGIELTRYYVTWAEQRLHDYKLDQLAKVKDIQPSWVVALDKVRIGRVYKEFNEKDSLLSQLHIGSSIVISDKRFIDGSNQLSLYIQQITYKYNESANRANFTPDVEVVLGTEYATTANPVATLQGQIDAINRQVGSLSNVAQVVRSVGDNVYLRKDVSDRTPYNLTIEGKLNIGNFIKGFSGANVDSFGNAEVESIVVRSYMKVFELIYNRLNALEGDTSFADCGTIETIIENADGSYTALMRRRWEGDFTSFQTGDVIYGYVNSIGTDGNGNLADESISKDGFLYYKAWALVKSVDRFANTLVLTKYNDIDVPAQKNFPMTDGMMVSRWGNALNPEDTTVQSNNEYASFIVNRGGRWINTRQQSFFISTEQGNLVELMGVNKPILERGNYGTVLGQIPDGLLDDETAALINSGQPYLYARGIIVQDLIRIGYEGVTVKTPNMRGVWDEFTAASETNYYRSTDDTVDIVSWEGALWQCVSQHASKEPPSDGNPDWIRLTAFGFQIWQVVPSVNTVYIRTGSYSTNLLECKVMLQDGKGEHEITTPEELDEYGMELVFTLDNEKYGEFWVRKGAVIDGIDIDEGSLEIGGNNVPWIEITDYIWLYLRDKETKEVKDAYAVPVVRDGSNGEDGESIQGEPGRDGTNGKGIEQRYKVISSDELAPKLSEEQRKSRKPDGWVTVIPVIEPFQDLYVIQATIDADDNLVGEWCSPMRLTGHNGAAGKQGLLVVPCGVFNESVTYRATEGWTPVVMYGYQNGVAQYYALKEGMTYYSGTAEDGRKNPAEDYTHSNGAKYWNRFDTFSMIYAEILMADFAKLGSAVFKDEFMFSQQGVMADGTTTNDNYTQFGQGFEPNFQVNFKTGHVVMRSGEYYGYMRQKKVVINDSNISQYRDRSGMMVSWEKTGGSIWFENLSSNEMMVLPYMYDNMEPETLEAARSYIGNNVVVYNDSSQTIGVVASFVKEERRYVDLDFSLTFIKYVSKESNMSVKPGMARTFQCVQAVDDNGVETVSWIAGEQVKIRK